jgi:hypothetical protein
MSDEHPHGQGGGQGDDSGRGNEAPPGGPAEIPRHERPISERYRLAAMNWVDKEAAARAYEELKTTTLETMKQGLIADEGDMPDSHAERKIKATPDWREYIEKMNLARTEANRARVYVDVLKMKFNEWQAADASRRAEMKMTR